MDSWFHRTDGRNFPSIFTSSTKGENRGADSFEILRMMMKVWKKPHFLPHHIFWSANPENLARKEEEFEVPCLETNKNGAGHSSLAVLKAAAIPNVSSFYLIPTWCFSESTAKDFSFFYIWFLLQPHPTNDDDKD